MKLCPNCGASAEVTQDFCVHCGQRLEISQMLPRQTGAREEIIGAIPFLAKAHAMYSIFELMREVSQHQNQMYTLVATSQRIILAAFSVQVMQEAMVKKREEAKGFMGKLLAGRVMGYQDMINHSQRYLSMMPE